jgi:hypothetical protein
VVLSAEVDASLTLFEAAGILPEMVDGQRR